MKIINELSYSQIKNNKKDTLATKLSIFLAVVLLGTVIFIIGSIKTEEYRRITSTAGDYQVSIAGVNDDMIDSFLKNRDIQRVSFDKFIKTDMDAIIIEKGAYYHDLKSFDIISGRNVRSAGEIIVPTRFLNKHKEYKTGSKLTVRGKVYKIVGEYDDYGKSFEETALIGVLADESKDSILKDADGIEAYIWYKNPRDTYTITKRIFKKFKMDYYKSLDTGVLYFNRDVLEYKMIYPSGIIPPKHVVAEAIESYGVCMVLVLLFAVMIYGAFNVWNNRDIKELALLKSVGMTEKQIKKMIRLKVIKIGILPILIGTVVSYLTANLLLYLMWLNNSITYKNMSNIFGERLKNAGFHPIYPSFPLILIIVILAFLTVYLSAIMPAGKSAKLNVVEGLTGITQNKIKYGKSKVTGQIESTLARDYFKAYYLTYKTIISALIISAMVMTLVLVSQSYRTVDSVYGKYNSPYNFTSNIYTSSNLNKRLIYDLKKVKGIDESHIYTNKRFKFYFKDNKGFEFDKLKTAFETGAKTRKELYVNIIGVSSEDFNRVISKNKLDIDSNYVLLNKIPDSNESPYSFRNYIQATDANEKDLVLRYNADGKQMPVHIDGYIDDFPFDLEEQSENGIYVFTRMENLEKFIEKYGQDEGDPVNYYMIRIKAKKNLDEVSDKCERIISAYIPENDHSTTNDIVRHASEIERLRNEHMLNFGIQSILIILALSNAYNSFHGNLRARRREFQLLSTAGMTEKQIKKMIYKESKILFRNAAIFYIAVFILAISVRSYRSEYEFVFISKEILFNLNYVPILMIFVVMVLGILLAIRSGIKTILGDDLNNTIKEI